MKKSFLAFLIALLAFSTEAQTTQFIQGTNDLAKTNILAADSDFLAAVSLTPTDPSANLYCAVTRLLAIPYLPAGSNFLTRAGFSLQGRDVFHWTSAPTNSAGELALPATLNGQDLTDQLRTNVIPTIATADSNLAQITSPGFTIFLPQTVTHVPDVTMDFGDVLMLRALANASEVYCYTLETLNADAQVSSISNVLKSDHSIEAVLANFPNLLTVTNAGDLAASRIAFSNAAELYFSASEFIRSRPPGETYLFNLNMDSQSEVTEEANFRTTLTNLLISLNGSYQFPAGDTNISISMASFFSGTNSWRSFLPQFKGNDFVWNSWADLTLGGIANGLTEQDLNQFALQKIAAYLQSPGIYFTNITSFPGGEYSQNSVIRATDGNFYGTTEYEGTNETGTVFRITADGTYTNIYTFTGPDGEYPNNVIQGNDGLLYGTAYGGSQYYGTIFSISTTGDFTTLYNFGTVTNDGRYPSDLVEVGNDYYGTTATGGTNDYGTIFRISSDGAFASVWSFQGGLFGQNPAGPLTLGQDGNLYGITAAGLVYRFTPSGGGATILCTADTNSPYSLTLAPDGSFYGMSQYGGDYGWGSIFHVYGSGNSFTAETIYSFDVLGQDLYGPFGNLVSAPNGVLYGLADYGGANQDGGIYGVDSSGDVSSVFWFTKDSGFSPNYLTSLTLGIDGNIYGSTQSGGQNGSGTIFELSFAEGSAVTATPTTGFVPLTVQFTSASVDNSGTAISSWHWTFGDGATSTAQSPAHTYTVAGNFQAILSATNVNGKSIVAFAPTIRVVSPTIPFSATPSSGLPPLVVQFSTTNVDNSGGVITDWSWNFGDGSTGSGENPSHTYAALGTYHPTVTATNNHGVLVFGAGPLINVTSLVQNGGFETGDFTGWTLTDTSGDTFVDDGSTTGITPHSGNYFAALGATGNLAYLSQTIPTVAGQMYLLSLWLDSPDGNTPNEFSVSWNGSILFDQKNIPETGWRNLQFTVAAAGTTTVLKLGSEDEPSYLGLDDVSVLPTTVATGPLVLLNGGFETGDFTDWNLIDPSGGTFVDNGTATGIPPHSGNYFAALGASDGPGYLSQSVSTVSGQAYLLSLWLDSPDGEGPNVFSVSWNGTVLFDQTNMPAFGWTNLQFHVTGTGPGAVLQIGEDDDPSYLGLDDVSIAPLTTTGPQIGFARSGANIILTWSTNATGFTLQSTTNLALPSSWSPVTTAPTVVSGQNVVTNPIIGKEMFFRLSQ